MRTLQDIQKEIDKILSDFGLYHDMMSDQLSLLFSTSLKELLEQVVPEEKEVISGILMVENPTKGFENVNNIGFNACRQEVLDRIKSLKE